MNEFLGDIWVLRTFGLVTLVVDLNFKFLSLFEWSHYILHFYFSTSLECSHKTWKSIFECKWLSSQGFFQKNWSSIMKIFSCSLVMILRRTILALLQKQHFTSVMNSILHWLTTVVVSDVVKSSDDFNDGCCKPS